MFELTVGTEIRRFNIRRFAALDGWDLQRRFKEFAASDPSNRELRRAYVMDVLGYASVVVANGNEIPLATDALIDNHLGTWENLQALFDEVLMTNGIDPKTHADNEQYWIKAGSQMATAFLAEVSTLIGPALAAANITYKQDS